MITVDLFLLVISAIGLTMTKWGDQLYITLIESSVLALITLILTTIEYFKLNPGYLEYTWQTQKAHRLNVSSGFYEGLDDDDSMTLDLTDRDKTMRKLLSKVKDDKMKK